jgi:hypothetical protein
VMPGEYNCCGDDGGAEPLVMLLSWDCSLKTGKRLEFSGLGRFPKFTS